jgi:hypothetical protein
MSGNKGVLMKNANLENEIKHAFTLCISGNYYKCMDCPLKPFHKREDECKVVSYCAEVCTGGK